MEDWSVVVDTTGQTKNRSLDATSAPPQLSIELSDNLWCRSLIRNKIYMKIKEKLQVNKDNNGKHNLLVGNMLCCPSVQKNMKKNTRQFQRYVSIFRQSQFEA